MQEDSESIGSQEQIPRVIDLSKAPGERQAWDRPRFVVYLWALVELLLVTNPLQISSSLRVGALRLFGAEVGENVVFRPRTRIKFPWKLHIGDRSWIGEGVWIHNQDHVYIGSDVVLSQEAFLTTGSHSVRKDMGLITRPIRIASGVWVTSRCIILGGASIGESSIVTPNTVVKSGAFIPAGVVFGQASAEILGPRFTSARTDKAQGEAI